MKRNRPSIIQLIEQEWTCPITSMPMKQPVITEDGHSYQKSHILQWFRKQRTSPKTGVSLSCSNIIPNLALKSVIQKFQTQVKYEFTKLTNENQQLIKTKAQLENKLKSLTEQTSKLKKQHQQIDQIKKQLLTLKTQHKQLLSQLNQVKQKYKTLQQQNQSYAMNISLIQQHKKIYQSKINSNDKQTDKSNIIHKLLLNNKNNQHFPLKQLFESNQKNQQVQQKQVLKMPKQPQRNFMLFDEYLMSFPVIYQDDKMKLDHSQCPIDMDFFLMHDWSHLIELNLKNCGIDNASFEKLANIISQQLTNLQILNLSMNSIANIKSQTLNKLKHLKQIILFEKGSSTKNPLDDQTIKLLQSYKRVHVQQKIQFEQEQKKNNNSL